MYSRTERCHVSSDSTFLLPHELGTPRVVGFIFWFSSSLCAHIIVFPDELPGSFHHLLWFGDKFLRPVCRSKGICCDVSVLYLVSFSCGYLECFSNPLGRSVCLFCLVKFLPRYKISVKQQRNFTSTLSLFVESSLKAANLSWRIL